VSTSEDIDAFGSWTSEISRAVADGNGTIASAAASRAAWSRSSVVGVAKVDTCATPRDAQVVLLRVSARSFCRSLQLSVR
jgi:hypothetical protein